AKVNGVRLKSQMKAAEPKAEAKPANANHEYTVTVGGKAYGVKLQNGKAIVNGVEYPLNVEDGIKASSAPKKVTKTTGSTEVKAPMPGLALRFNVKVGDAVKKDQVLCVMEAMKMENEIYSPCDGTVASISVNQGDQLQGGDVIMTIA
ncbi:MAG: biotin attachment protein, partial [Spirochaetales bacterium]|nr:biotin attachment protein [Spirochaetales bacterium]